MHFEGWRAWGPALRMSIVSWLLCGVAVPLLIVFVGEALVPAHAQGSMLRGPSGQVVGSADIGQDWTSPRWFWGRPSATLNPATGKPEPYAANNSGGSNLGPTNSALKAEVQANLQAFLAGNPGVSASQVPLDLLESSGSGLDPDITPASAYIQVPRVARATGLPAATLDALVAGQTHDGLLVRLFGAPFVNVLRLNVALARTEGAP
jgi:K+-transporting ATPase ATPase C chain